MASSPETTIPEDSIENNKLPKDSYDEDLGHTVWPEVPKFPFQPDENEKNGDKTTDEEAQAQFSDKVKQWHHCTSETKKKHKYNKPPRTCGEKQHTNKQPEAYDRDDLGAAYLEMQKALKSGDLARLQEVVEKLKCKKMSMSCARCLFVNPALETRNPDCLALQTAELGA